MLDFGWAEMFMIAAVAVFVIGPKDIPGVMRSLGKLMRRFQYAKHAISQQFEDIMAETDVTDVNFEAHNESIMRAPEDAEFNEANEDEDVMLPLDHEKKEGSNDD